MMDGTGPGGSVAAEVRPGYFHHPVGLNRGPPQALIPRAVMMVEVSSVRTGMLSCAWAAAGAGAEWASERTVLMRGGHLGRWDQTLSPARMLTDTVCIRLTHCQRHNARTN